MLNTRSAIQEQRGFLKRRLSEQKEKKIEHKDRKRDDRGSQVGMVN